MSDDELTGNGRRQPWRRRTPSCSAARAEIAAYDLEALTTGGRYWVRGTGTGWDGHETPYAFFVKVVQSWARSPLFAQGVPEEYHAQALAMVPWRCEPGV